MKTYSVTCVMCNTTMTFRADNDHQEDIEWVCSLCQDIVDDECKSWEIDNEDEIYGNS